MADGLKASLANSDPWPPTLPEFRSRCLGIPPFQQVRIEVHASKRSPFTMMVWQQIDGYQFKQVSAEKSDRMLKEAYELARELVMRGVPLPEIPEHSIEQQQPQVTPASKEQVSARLDEIDELLK